MTSINLLVHTLGSNASSENPVTIKEIMVLIYEINGEHARYDTIQTYMRRDFAQWFIRTEKVIDNKKKIMYHLSSSGLRKFNKIKDIYDPVTNTIIGDSID